MQQIINKNEIKVYRNEKECRCELNEGIKIVCAKKVWKLCFFGFTSKKSKIGG